jgi:hypothetical protein
VELGDAGRRDSRAARRRRRRGAVVAPPMPMIEMDKEGLAYQRNVRSGIQSLSKSSASAA